MPDTSARCGCCAHRVHSIGNNKNTQTTQSIDRVLGAPFARGASCVR